MKRQIIALLLILILVLTGCTGRRKTEQTEKPLVSNDTHGVSTTLAKAIYPVSVPYPNEANYNNDWEKYNDLFDTWWKEETAVHALKTSDTGIRDYVTTLTEQLLKDADSNAVISPANLYFALAMLANTTDGNTQKQVLDFLGYDDTDKLNANTKNLWRKLYKNDGLTTSILANSLWLSEDNGYNTDTVNKLRDELYSSTFAGDFTDPAYSQALRDWLNEQTGGLLQDKTEGVGFSDETVFAIASTIYYKAQWHDKFHELNTKADAFHGTDGDTTVDFMHTGFSRQYFWSDDFSATAADLEGGGKMLLILPDEDKSIDNVLTSDSFIDLITESGKVENKYISVNLALPKFDVSYDKNIAADLQTLGITDAFDDAKADFSPLITGIPMELTSVNHAARVRIDEEGCEAAAYTVMKADGTSAPPKDEVDLVLNRPFIFAITGTDGLPRFVGIVNNI